MLIRAKSVINTSSPSLLQEISTVCHCNLITNMQYGICICHLHKLLVNEQQLSYDFINVQIKWMTKNALVSHQTSNSHPFSSISTLHYIWLPTIYLKRPSQT
jgi:hypothetical protein